MDRAILTWARELTNSPVTGFIQLPMLPTGQRQSVWQSVPVDRCQSDLHYTRRLNYHEAMSMKFTTRSLVLLLVLCAGPFAAWAQETRDNLLGSWEGGLTLGRDEMSLAFTFTEQAEGYGAALISGGLGIYGMPADSVSLEGRRLTIRIARLDLEFTGTIRFDESGEKILRIDGDWFQYSEMVPVVLLPVDSPSF